MYKKINEIAPMRNERGARSDLYTRYKKAFDKILPLNDARPNSKKDLATYLPDKELDKELETIKNEENDSLSILIGYGGIGKSTSLRHFFEFVNAVPTFIDRKTIIVFPVIFNANVINSEKDESISDQIRNNLALRIDTVCTLLENEYPDLKTLFYSEKGQLDFYNYIYKTNPRVLELLPYDQRLNLSEKEEKLKKLYYAYNHDRFICSATKLKFYLGNKKCASSKLIVIVDDIEPLPYKVQVELIMQYLRFFECMRNVVNADKFKEYVVNFIISMRPHTYRILKEYRAFQAFFITRVICKKNMLNLAKYFRRKIEFYADNISHENMESWNEACRVLDILNNKFNARYSTMIKNLSLWNTRDAIELYKQVLENRVWIQRNMEKTSGFTVSEDNYVFNNITVLRAIACGHYYVYSQRENCCVPNILLNTSDKKNYSLINMYIFSLFHAESSNKDWLYGMKYRSYREIVNCFITTFPNMKEIKNDVQVAIKYLFQKKVLRKSINDTDKIEYLDSYKSLSDDSLLYLSPKGNEIWNMLCSDSVYLELCREDYYRDYNNPKNIKESSYELMQAGKQTLIFYDLLSLLLELLDLEYVHVECSIQNDTIDIFKKNFGNNTMIEYLYMGVTRSIEFSGNSDNDTLAERKYLLETKIRKLKDLLV